VVLDWTLIGLIGRFRALKRGGDRASPPLGERRKVRLQLSQMAKTVGRFHARLGHIESFAPYDGKSCNASSF
jgi:hypothetical protein